ncbi:MAG: hypothetical protein IPH53_22875 [Flavobacteriales bacterium]|nr:hypothetical protein [Flavobacteriales bacterium]
MALQADKANLTNGLGVVSGEKAALEEKSRSQEEIISQGLCCTPPRSVPEPFSCATVATGGYRARQTRRNGEVLLHIGREHGDQCRSQDIVHAIISPDGSVLPASDGNNRFQFNGVEGEYSAKREMDYANAPVDVCVFWTATGEMKSGHYNVEIYENKALVSKTGFDLK